MQKDITFTADGATIEKARARAHAENTTLEDIMRRRLEDYVHSEEEGERRVAKFRQTMEKLSHIEWDGRKLTREEMNER